MRFEGKLVRWNADRGFGFILPDQGGQELFAHVSAFPWDGRTPRLGEPLSFDVERGPDGRKRAARVERPGTAPGAATRLPTAPHRARGTAPHGHRRGRSRGIAGLLTLVLLCGLGFYGYRQYQRYAGLHAAGSAGSAPALAAGAEPALRPASFQCDGRLHCSQMTSCAEAKLFLAHCPGTMMDGDHDGVPCEQQWCTGPLAR